MMSACITILFEILMPLLIGAFFGLPANKTACESKTAGGEKSCGLLLTLARAYAFGQILLFAIFEPIAVFGVLKDQEMPFIIKTFLAASAVITIFFWILIISKKLPDLKGLVKSGFDKPSVFGILAFLIFLFMIVMSFIMTYTDGDDAFYITVAADAASSDSLYAKNPYTGFATTLLFRYIFAPFPLWISFLSRVSGMNVSALAHTFFPWSMILLSFAVMYIIADMVTDGDRKKRGAFMFFASLLVMFGDYSIYSASNFLLARSRQGKAALATFVIPFLFMILYSSFKEMEEMGKISFKNLLFICASGFSAALCSTMGGALVISFTGLSALMMAFTYKKIKYPFFAVLSSVPSIAFAVLYMVMR